jgi:hypothetical protein
MNATSLDDLRLGLTTRDPNEDKMEQIRDLVYGDFKRQCDVRIGQLEARMRELELGVQQRLDSLQARLDGLAGEVARDRRASLDEIARGLQDLGERVRRIPGD